MATKKVELERVRVASPCRSPWEAMQGDGRRRLCLECDKPVYDFAQLTPREVAGLLEASRGQLCGRVTRDGAGRLVTLEPPPVAIGGYPLPHRRPSPLVAAAVTAFLGLAGAARTDPAPPASPAAEQGAGERPGGDRPRRGGDAGGTLGGRLATEAGEPVANAEVTASNQLDHQERTARTDAQGRYSFAALTPGIYGLRATVRGHGAAQQWDLLVAAGEKREAELTVPADVWQRIVAGEPEQVALGGAIAMPEEPLRRLYDGASLAVLGVAGKSVVVGHDEYTSEVRTDLTISAVVKGETRERVISVFHHQEPDEEAASRLAPGAELLAFLEPREAENGRGSDGYVLADAWSAVKILPDAEVEPYRERLEALARIPGDGVARPEAVLEWLVATAEEPATRREAVGELGEAVGRLEEQARRHDTPVDRYARDLRQVLGDFLAAGGRPEGGEVDPAILAAFLTGAQRERLTAALLRTRQLTEADFDLYRLVAPWHQDRLLPWLARQLGTADLVAEEGRRVMLRIAQTLGDSGLSGIQAAGEARIESLEQELQEAPDAAARKRLGAELAAAEEELRRQLVEALVGRAPR